MSSSKNILLEVAAKAVVLNSSGEVLILREAATDKNNTKVGYWGLAGGRIDPGETFLDGLKREVMEETGLHIKVGKPLYVGEWRPVINKLTHQIVGVFMLCTSNSKQVRLSDEHDDCKWINPKKRTAYRIMEPDCFVIDELSK